MAHREQRPAIRHQRLGEPRHADEEMAGDVHRQQKALARAVDHAAVQVLPGRKRDRVQRESSRPQRCAIASNTASICPAAATSSGIKTGASSSVASGSTQGLAFSLR
jgi:hypothetical protein